jgi:hypothetical protein
VGSSRVGFQGPGRENKMRFPSEKKEQEYLDRMLNKRRKNQEKQVKKEIRSEKNKTKEKVKTCKRDE